MGKRKHASNVKSPFQFDAALSFDGNDRETARLIAEAGKRVGLKCFIDEENRAHFWGKNESAFQPIYGPSSRFVVPLVSKNYVDNVWTRHEFELARREADNRDHEFILPVRIDDTPLLGLPEGTIFLSLDDTSPEQIAEILKQKIEQIFGQATEAGGRPLTLLRSDERLALGILVTAAFPRRAEYYRRLFPSISWHEILPRLVDLELILNTDEIPVAYSRAKAAFPRDSAEFRQLEDAWITRLEPLRGHIDIAPALAIHWMRANRAADAAETLADVAAGTELGWWNSIYLKAIELIVENRLQSLPKQTKLETLNAYGICLSRDGRFEDAFRAFKRLRSSASRANDDYWVGQSLINQGVAQFHSDNVNAAIKLYEKAKTHGERTEDWRLVGRCLGNLAESLRDTDPAKSRELLSESIKLKRKVKDRDGLTAAEMQFGNLEAHIGQPLKAVQHFRKCVDQSDACGDRHLKSLALYNLGNAHYELGRSKQAISYYAKSLKIAEEDRFPDCVHFAALGLGRAAFEIGMYEKAKDAFETLLDWADEVGEIDDKICSLHALAVIKKIVDGDTFAKPLFTQSIRFARTNGLGDWYARCISDRSRQRDGNTLGAVDLGAIERTARHLEKKSDNLFAGHVLFLLARQLSWSETAGPEEAADAYHRAEICLRKSDDHEALLQLLLELSDWQWQVGKFEESIESMCRAELVAIDTRNFRRACEAADQIGVRLQKLARFDDATKCHSRAVKLARKHRFIASLETFLNNLGESLRKTGQFGEAETTFLEAEQLAAVIDEEAAISIAHNRALAYQDSGTHDRAELLFKQLRARSKRRGFWSEYVRAIEALANLACIQQNNGISRRRYLDAIATAKKQKLKESLPRLTLNYAEMELYLGNPKQAKREIQRVIPDVKQAPDEHLFYQVLGRACMAANKPELAITPLQQAADLAGKVGDNKNAARALSELANAFEQLNRYEEAVRSLEQTIAEEPDPDLKVAALDQLLRIQLSSDEDAAQSTYDKAAKLIEEHDLVEGSVRIHLTIGKHYWTGNEDKKLEALQAFVVAVTQALVRDVSDPDRDEGDSLCGEVSSEIIRLLTQPDTAVSEKQLATLLDKLTQWVNKQISSKIWRKTALTPIRLAQELLPFKDSPRAFVDQLDRLIESGKYFS